MKLRKLAKHFWLPAAILLLNELILSSINAYQYWWLDEFMHFFSGAAVAASFALVLKELAREKKYYASLFFSAIFTVSFVAFVAVIWEWHEFIRAIITNSPQIELFDTLKDIFIGVLGSVFVCLFLKMTSCPTYRKRH